MVAFFLDSGDSGASVLARAPFLNHSARLMANSGRPSVNKRNREQARKERTQEKAQERSQRAAQRLAKGDTSTNPDEDPDIAHIIPGPQPIPQ